MTGSLPFTSLGGFAGDGSLVTGLNGANFTPGTVNSNAIAAGTLGPEKMTTYVQTQLALAGTGSPGAAASGTNMTTAGVRTNLESLFYPIPYDSTLNVQPAPDVYMLSPWFQITLTNLGEAQIWVSNTIVWMGSNSVPYNYNYLQLDAGWAARDGAGNLIFDTFKFPSWTGRQLCAFAHAHGVRIGLYVWDSNSTDGANLGAIDCATNEINDVWTFATNFCVDGIKVDGHCATLMSALLKTTRPIFRQISAGTDPYAGAGYGLSAELAEYYNSIYVTYHGADSEMSSTNLDTCFGLASAKFATEMNATAYTRPGCFTEGVGWIQGDAPHWAYGLDSYCWPQCCAMDMAAALCSRVLGSQWVITNREYLSILGDPLVRPGKVVADTSMGVTNFACCRTLSGGVKYVVYVNNATSTWSPSLTSSWLGLGPGAAFTLLGTYSHAIEAWATNAITVSVPPRNTLSFRVKEGNVSPRFCMGTNYLSDQPWRFSVSAPAGERSLDRDYNLADGTSTTNLVLNSVIYGKGLQFCDLSSISPTTVEFSLGKRATNFTAWFGKQDQYLIYNLSGVQLSIWTNGVLALQTDWITNADQVATISLSMVGVDVLKLSAIGSDGALGIGALGGCYVVVPDAYAPWPSPYVSP